MRFYEFLLQITYLKCMTVVLRSFRSIFGALIVSFSSCIHLTTFVYMFSLRHFPKCTYFHIQIILPPSLCISFILFHFFAFFVTAPFECYAKYDVMMIFRKYKWHHCVEKKNPFICSLMRFWTNILAIKWMICIHVTTN